MKLNELNFLYKPVRILKKLLIFLSSLLFFAFQINSSRTFTTNDGLLDNSIVDINQDVLGQLWVVTRSSISIFNGSHWKNFSTKFQHQDNPFNSFQFEYKRILIDEKDNKYFLSKEGLVFLLKKNNLIQLVSPFQAKGIFFNEIQLVNDNGKQIIWASTERNGLAYFDNGWFSFGINEGLISERILNIKSLEDFLIIITDRGIQVIKDRRVVYTFITNVFIRFKNFSCAFDKFSKVKQNIPAIWILADNRLLKFENEKITDLTFKFFNPYRENYSLIYGSGNNKIFLANSHLIKIVNPVTYEIKFLGKEVGISGSIQVLFFDLERNLWIGTDKALTRINFTNISKFTDEDGLSDIKIISSHKLDRKFYFGHSDGRISFFSNSKLFQFNFTNQLISYQRLFPKRNYDIVKIGSIQSKIIFQVGNWGIFELHARSIIKPLYIITSRDEFINDFQTISEGGLILCGQFLRNGSSSSFISLSSEIDFDSEELFKSNKVEKIYLARDGSIYLSTQNAQILKLHRGRIEELNLPEKNFTKITLIREDKGSNIFIGTDNGFIVLMKSGEVKTYLQNLSNEKEKYEIYSFYFDDYNNLWLMTNKGLRFWNWKEFKFSSEWRNIVPNTLNENAINELDNNIFVSAENGLFILPSDENEIREIQPRVFISEIVIDGNSFDAFSEVSLQKIKELTIRFNAVLLSANNNIEFSYKLDGFDSNWSSPTNSREIKYVNLPKGEYKFLVRARTNYSNWTTPVSSNLIEIKIPLYYNYELLIIFTLTLLIGVLIFFSLKSRKELKSNSLASIKNQVLALEKQNKQLRQEINKALELSKSRMTFLASLSHELRTPITSLIGFVDVLLDSKLNLTEEEKIKYLNYISVNSRRLLILMNDVIDLARIDAGTITLDFSDINLNAEVRDIINLFREKIKSKQLDLILELDSDLETQNLNIDRNRLHQIIFNLVTNAIKFTEEGYIKISTKKEGDKFLLVVEDTGIGIPKEEISFIFEEFKRSSIAMKKSIEGSGLGLSITKRLVELMGGEIKVESQEGVGSNFIVIFPSRKESSKKFETNLTTNRN